MAVFSTNQTRHLYVAKSIKTEEQIVSAAGDLKLVTTGDAPYFLYVGADGTPMRSDLLTNVEHVKVTSSDAMKKTLPATYMSISDVVAGQHYIMKVTFKNFLGASEEHTLTVVADYTAKTGDAAKNVYAGLAVVLAKNLSKHVTPLATVHLATAKSWSGAVDVKASDDPTKLTGSYTGIIIRSAKQPHVLGTKSADVVNFDVAIAPITANGVDTIVGVIDNTFVSNLTVDNGETIADMEYFYMKERADQYGNMGWPNVVHTEYLVDPTKKYNTLDIHYSYVGSNEAVQKSEKTITIVSESDLTSLASALTDAGVTPTEE